MGHLPRKSGEKQSPGWDLDKVGAREVLNALADGAYITNLDRRITFWSHAAEQITGWPASEVVGHACADNILVHIDKDGHRLCGEEHCPLRRAIVTGEQSRVPLLVFAQHKQGHRIPVEVSVGLISHGISFWTQGCSWGLDCPTPPRFTPWMRSGTQGRTVPI